MSEDRFGIPALRNNPFQAPLEKGKSDLLVGGESARWIRFIKARNARMILLIVVQRIRGDAKSVILTCSTSTIRRKSP